MNAPLPDHIRKALETVTLDDNSRSGLSRRHKYSGGEADCAVFGARLLRKGGAA